MVEMPCWAVVPEKNDWMNGGLFYGFMQPIVKMISYEDVGIDVHDVFIRDVLENKGFVLLGGHGVFWSRNLDRIDVVETFVETGEIGENIYSISVSAVFSEGLQHGEWHVMIAFPHSYGTERNTGIDIISHLWG